MNLLAIAAAAALFAATACSPARPAASPPAPEGSHATAPAVAPAEVMIAASAGRPGSPPAGPPAGLAVSVAASSPVDFANQIRPILEARCRPCHFPGGKMYDRLPFDRAETIHRLGDKLFTRIKAEDEQDLLRAFLAQSAEG
jgi:hypothetical protein